MTLSKRPDPITTTPSAEQQYAAALIAKITADAKRAGALPLPKPEPEPR